MKRSFNQISSSVVTAAASHIEDGLGSEGCLSTDAGKRYSLWHLKKLALRVHGEHNLRIKYARREQRAAEKEAEAEAIAADEASMAHAAARAESALKKKEKAAAKPSPGRHPSGFTGSKSSSKRRFGSNLSVNQVAGGGGGGAAMAGSGKKQASPQCALSKALFKIQNGKCSATMSPPAIVVRSVTEQAEEDTTTAAVEAAAVAAAAVASVVEEAPGAQMVAAS
eukprot:g4577.t1